LIVYASAYLRHYYAPEFTAAILNAQPMGFYAPGTLVEDARRHGVEVRPVDLTRSAWDATLEQREMQIPRSARNDGEESASPAVRLGVRSVRGLGSTARDKLEDALKQGPFTSIDDVVKRAGLDRRSLRHLAEAGAFDPFLPGEPDLRKRRAALWEVLDAARGDAGPLAPRRRAPAAQRAPIPAMTPVEITEADYRMTGISLAGHPMSHVRTLMDENGVRCAKDLLRHGQDGETVAMAGLVICRQRPGTAKGFVFLTLEDETGLVNVVVTPPRFERQALLISRTPLLLVRGVLQVEQNVVNIRAKQFRALEAAVGAEFARGHDFH
jgi:error-prone DNA polymerase